MRTALQGFTAALVVVAAGVGGVRCRRAPVPGLPPRLVVLYATCSLNRLYLAPYDESVRYTPSLSAFAAEATVFLRHQTEAGQSGVAFASLFAGTQADRHGVFQHPSWLRDEAHLVAEAFSERGYDTYYWSGHGMAAADLNYAQGVAPEHVYPHSSDDPERARLTANDPRFVEILDRLRADPTYRAFVQVAFTLTHAPYTDLEPAELARFRRDYPDLWPSFGREEVARLERRYRRQRRRLERNYPNVVRAHGWTPVEMDRLARLLEAYYVARVNLLDRWFGRFVDQVREAGMLDESLIAFTADHGETLYREHGLFKWGHGLELSPDVVQVPLIVRLPGPGGVPVYPGVSRSIDVHPTLLGLAGVPLGDDARIEGVDLSGAVRGRAEPPSLRAFSHTTVLDEPRVADFRSWLVGRFYPASDVNLVWTAVRDGDTYVRRRRSPAGSWSTEAFDLAADPGAARDVFDPADSRHRALARELDDYKARLVRAHDRLSDERSLSDSERVERLRALGYLE